MILNSPIRRPGTPLTDGIIQCAAAANAAVKPAPSAHRCAASGLTATRGREFAIHAVDAVLYQSRPQSALVDVHDRADPDANGSAVGCRQEVRCPTCLRLVGKLWLGSRERDAGVALVALTPQPSELAAAKTLRDAGLC